MRDFVPAGTSFSSAGQGGTLVTFSSAAGVPGVWLTLAVSRACSTPSRAERLPSGRYNPATMPGHHVADSARDPHHGPRPDERWLPLHLCLPGRQPRLFYRYDAVTSLERRCGQPYLPNSRRV